MKDKKMIVLQVTREEVETCDVTRILDIFLGFLQSPREFYDSVEITVSGYDDDPRELWEIPEVKRWFETLDKAWPFAFFFMSTLGAGLRVLALCCIGAETIDENTVQVSPLYMAAFMSEHFVPMNAMFELVSLSDEENCRRTDELMLYFLKGSTVEKMMEG